MSLTVHCFIPAAYSSFVKYKWAVHAYPIVMKIYRTTPLYVQYIPQKFRSQRINQLFTKNHTRQHTQICPDRISCNLQIKPLFLCSSKCCETTSITTICVLEFIKNTPSIIIHRIWFNTLFSCCKHQICQRDSFSTYSYKIINK